jgi:hypothetical protein
LPPEISTYIIVAKETVGSRSDTGNKIAGDPVAADPHRANTRIRVHGNPGTVVAGEDLRVINGATD